MQTNLVRGVVVALLMAFAAIRGDAQAPPTTVILVRHAEKESAPAADPRLTAAGQERAHALWHAVRDAGVTAIITTQFARTKETAQPTAAALGLTPHVVMAGGADHVRDVVAAIRQHLGSTVLVVGHSNTVPAIIGALGAKQPADICDAEYDNLYIVTIHADGTASLIRTKYGAPSPVDTRCAAMN